MVQNISKIFYIFSFSKIISLRKVFENFDFSKNNIIFVLKPARYYGIHIVDVCVCVCVYVMGCDVETRNKEIT